MAKKSAAKSVKDSTFFKPLPFVLLLLVTAAGYIFWFHKDQLEYYLSTSLESPDKDETILCFEAKITPQLLQQRLEKNSSRNSQLPQIVWGEGRICYTPHLLVDVKYTLDGKTTKTGRMLWDLVTSELVLDTNQFETTRGFQDCLQSQATAEDFRILRLLSQNNGLLSKEQLQRELTLDEELLSARIESLKKKQLIVKVNDIIRIHVDNPILGIEPTTKLTLPLSKITVKRHLLLPQEQTHQQLLSMIQVAFGPTVGIKGYKKLFIPVIELNRINSDGSITTSHWNAVNGRPMAMNGR